eukprot:1289773-Lingulodinium_polyedra.AAC.1
MKPNYSTEQLNIVLDAAAFFSRLNLMERFKADVELMHPYLDGAFLAAASMSRKCCMKEQC